MKTPGFCVLLALIFVAYVGFGFPAAGQTPVLRPQAFDAGERFFPMLNRVLTDEQRSSLRVAVENQRYETQPLEEKLRTSRRAVLDAAASGKFDETFVRQNAEVSAKAEAELMMIYARALSQIQPPLTPQQIQQLKNFQPARALPQSAPGTTTTEKHLDLPPSLPRDSNDLPVVK